MAISQDHVPNAGKAIRTASRNAAPVSRLTRHNSRLTRPNRFRTRSLGALATSLGTLGASSTASATIITELSNPSSPGVSIQLTPGLTGELALVSMGGSMLDLRLEGGMTMNPATPVVFDAVAAGMGMSATSFLNLRNQGDIVDNSLTFLTRGELVKANAVNPEWSAVTTGYAGFSFHPDTTTLYGWLKIDFDGSNPTTFSVTQWAYEDSGTAITVGDTGEAPAPTAVPEPGSGLMLGLGLAGLVVAGRKLGRREAQRRGRAREAR